MNRKIFSEIVISAVLICAVIMGVILANTSMKQYASAAENETEKSYTPEEKKVMLENINECLVIVKADYETKLSRNKWTEDARNENDQKEQDCFKNNLVEGIPVFEAPNFGSYAQPSLISYVIIVVNWVVIVLFLPFTILMLFFYGGHLYLCNKADAVKKEKSKKYLRRAKLFLLGDITLVLFFVLILLVEKIL